MVVFANLRTGVIDLRWRGDSAHILHSDGFECRIILTNGVIFAGDLRWIVCFGLMIVGRLFGILAP